MLSPADFAGDNAGHTLLSIVQVTYPNIPVETGAIWFSVYPTGAGVRVSDTAFCDATHGLVLVSSLDWTSPILNDPVYARYALAHVSLYIPSGVTVSLLVRL